MKAKQWEKLLARIIVWLAAEIFLNLLGLDDLADYSEFIFEQNQMIIVSTDFSPSLFN